MWPLESCRILILDDNVGQACLAQSTLARLRQQHQLILEAPSAGIHGIERQGAGIALS